MNNNYNSQNFPYENNDVFTQSFADSILKYLNKNGSNLKVDENDNIYKSINKINDRLDELQKENMILRHDLNETRSREHKLLNRFSFLIQIINVGSIVLIIMAAILFIDSFYPFVKGLISNSLGATIVIGAIGTAISGGIIALWCKFNEYVQKVIEREKK